MFENDPKSVLENDPPPLLWRVRVLCLRITRDDFRKQGVSPGKKDEERNQSIHRVTALHDVIPFARRRSCSHAAFL